MPSPTTHKPYVLNKVKLAKRDTKGVKPENLITTPPSISQPTVIWLELTIREMHAHFRFDGQI